MEKNISTQYEYAWKYFSLHASQRLSTFNFYIVISTLLTTGLYATYENNLSSPSVGIVLGTFLMIISVVFKKLDSRNRQLINNAEKALKYLETLISKDILENTPNNPLTLFSNEERETNEINSKLWIIAPGYIFSYSYCFGVIFFSFFMFGVIGVVLSIFSLIN